MMIKTLSNAKNVERSSSPSPCTTSKSDRAVPVLWTEDTNTCGVPRRQWMTLPT